MLLTDILYKTAVWGLLLLGRALPTNTAPANRYLPDNSDLVMHANPYLFNSLCNTHGHFVNKVPYVTAATTAQDLQIEQRRQIAEKSIEQKVASLERTLKNKGKTLFKSNSNFAPIKNYLKLMVDLVEQAKLRRHESTGYCGEAAAASVVNSLLEQINTNQRETVQLLTITDQYQDLGHVFVLYNSVLLKSQWLNNKELTALITNTQAPGKDRPVICDEFGEFHSYASEWAGQFFAQNHMYAKGAYVHLDVVDCSLPSLEGFTKKQQKFITDTLVDILSEVKMCDINEDILYCRH